MYVSTSDEQQSDRLWSTCCGWFSSTLDGTPDDRDRSSSLVLVPSRTLCIASYSFPFLTSFLQCQQIYVFSLHLIRHEELNLISTLPITAVKFGVCATVTLCRNTSVFLMGVLLPLRIHSPYSLTHKLFPFRK